MTQRPKFLMSACLLFVIANRCVPIQQQISERESLLTEGFVGPLILDKKEFNARTAPLVYDRSTSEAPHLPSNNNMTFETTFAGKIVYVRNCRCFREVQIIQSKLVLFHTHNGDETREHTRLLWNGEYYKNSKGEYVVDVLLVDDNNSLHRNSLEERKVFNVEALKFADASLVWINLLTYKQLIRYDY